MKEYYLFAKRFLTHPASIGSLVPSSKRLGKQMVSPIAASVPHRYLEVGAGSGAVTQYIVEKMCEGDTLDIVESDPCFCRTLQEKYRHHPNITIYPISILDFTQRNYDVVLSSLPLNAFRSGMVHRILHMYPRLVKSGGVLVYFEYIGFGSLKRWFCPPALRRDFQKTLSLKQAFVAHHQASVKKIWRNFPPARVFCCHFSKHTHKYT